MKMAQERIAWRAEEQRKEDIIAAEKARLLEEAGPLKQYLPRAVLDDTKKLEPLMPAYLD